MSRELIEKIIFTVLGGILGFASSIGVIIVEKIMANRGNLLIFYKRIYSHLSCKPWGIREFDITLFEIPIKFEIQNTSSVLKVVRDLSMYLYEGEEEVDKFTSIEYYNYTEDNKKIKEICANEGSYSFVIPSKSIVNFKCYFSLKKSKNNEKFDNVKLSYYDHNNKKHIYDICRIEKGWNSDEFFIDKDWIMLE
ncbi:hypothetical protein [Parvimonas micra]